jgi:hypothetical protein
MPDEGAQDALEPGVGVPPRLAATMSADVSSVNSDDASIADSPSLS